jgi:hypothetical protein
MKRDLLIALIAFFAFISCRKVDNSSLDKPCTGSCVTITGRFTTSENQPLANVPIEIRSERSTSRYSYEVRRIAKTKTDENGYYAVQFALKDYEYGLQATASVHLEFSYDENQYLPIHKYYKDIRLSYEGAAFERPDVTLVKNVYLPRLAKANVTLSGFTPPMDYANNYFAVGTYSKAGADGQERGVSGFIADASLITKEIAVGGNDSTRFNIERRKNGVTTIKDTTVYTPVGKVTRLTFQF